jgi:hypothetical protein
VVAKHLRGLGSIKLQRRDRVLVKGVAGNPGYLAVT